MVMMMIIIIPLKHRQSGFLANSLFESFRTVLGIVKIHKTDLKKVKWEVMKHEDPDQSKEAEL